MVDPIGCHLDVAFQATVILLQTCNVVLEDYTDGEVSSSEAADHLEDTAQEVV